MMRVKLLAILMTLVMGAGVAFADTEDSAFAEVYVNVVANVSVDYLGSVVVMPDVQTGPVTGNVVFRVDANLQVIELWVAVSNLYKDDSPLTEWQIPVDVARRVGVDPVIGEEIPTGQDNALELIPDSVAVGPYPIGYRTVNGTFGSGQNNHFSQEVVVTPHWIQPDPELPIGEYSGMVVLTALVL